MGTHPMMTLGNPQEIFPRTWSYSTSTGGQLRCRTSFDMLNTRSNHECEVVGGGEDRDFGVPRRSSWSCEIGQLLILSGRISHSKRCTRHATASVANVISLDHDAIGTRQRTRIFRINLRAMCDSLLGLVRNEAMHTHWDVGM